MTSSDNATTATQKVFDCLDQVCRDLNSLANDFGSALEQRGHVFEEKSEYSYSPQFGLIVKPLYTWYWQSLTRDDAGITTLRLAAMIAVFRMDKPIVPVGNARPQLWFALGSGAGSDVTTASVQASNVHKFLCDAGCMSRQILGAEPPERAFCK